MMAAPTSLYVCQECGGVHRRWRGKCDHCGQWNTLVEEAQAAPVPGGLKKTAANITRSKLEFVPLKGKDKPLPRWRSSIGEFDRVTGGGLVPGSALLIGGDPGIGKSTLLLQISAALASQNVGCAYISGEESVAQVRLRAQRLGLSDSPLALAAATSVRDIVASFKQQQAVNVVIIDSIQTMYLDNIEAAPGSVSQVRGSAQELVRAAKKQGFALLIVGHVTKDGAIAGPKVVEHMVDAVLHFEGDRHHHFRILRAIKNRFGPADELGVFEMVEQGLQEVGNPSALFLNNRGFTISGTTVFAGIEGTRPLLIEIQALVAPSSLAAPRRTVVGWDSGRLAMVLAVLESRCGLKLSGKDVYLNVAGGMRVNEPGADLAVAVALVSALANKAAPADMIVFGEIGLSGEIRAVSQSDSRLKEAVKLGFEQAMVPESIKERKTLPQGKKPAIKALTVNHVRDVLAFFT